MPIFILFVNAGALFGGCFFPVSILNLYFCLACRLLRLNPGAQVEHLTSKLIWVAA